MKDLIGKMIDGFVGGFIVFSFSVTNEGIITVTEVLRIYTVTT